MKIGVRKGKNIGNQLNISGEWVLGWIEIITSLYKTDSKYPAIPCIVVLSFASNVVVWNLTLCRLWRGSLSPSKSCLFGWWKDQMLSGSAICETCWNMTTYGVSLCSRSLYAATSLQSLVEESGAMYVVYDEGMEIPSAG